MRSVVNWLPRCLEIPNTCERIRPCQHWSLKRLPLVRRLSLQPGEDRLRTGVERDDERSLAAQQFLAPHKRFDGRATTGGYHHLVLS